MLQSKTLFIIGAGASYEVGLPIGSGLKERIANLIDIRFEDGWHQDSGDHQITHELRQAATNGDINPFLHKAWRIRDALPTAISIDNLLDAHRGDAEIDLCGKLGIARAILMAERESVLRQISETPTEFSYSALSNTWLIPLFQLITENVRRDSIHDISERVSFIIFNYDRVIEFFLPYAIANYYGVERSIAEEIVRSITFIHPYGQVGYLPYQSDTPKVPFGSDRYNLGDVAKQVRTFAEGLYSPNLRESIRTEIYEAEAVVFLGFAFHPINMAVLASDLSSPVMTKVFGTTYGLSGADEDVVESDILRIFRKRGPSEMRSLYEEEMPHERLDTLELKSLKCYDFLTQYFRSIGARA